MQLSQSTKSKIGSLSNALIFPHPMPPFVENPAINWFHGIEAEGRIDTDLVDHMRFGRSVIKANLRNEYLHANNESTLSGKWLYAGPLLNHFGHFLSESVGRLWAWKYLKDEVDGLLYIPWSNKGCFKLENMGAYFFDFMELIGLDTDRIHCIDELTRVDEVIIPQSGAHLGASQSKWYLNELVTTLPFDKLSDSKISKKVVFSREKFLHSGKFAGFSAIEKAYCDRGYNIVFPENLSFIDQLKTIYNSDHCVWEESSNIHILDIFPVCKMRATIYKRRPKLKTFDTILNEKASVVNVFDQVDILPDISMIKPSDALDAELVLGEHTSRTSLSVPSGIDKLVDFLDRDLNISSPDKKVISAEYAIAQYRDFEKYSEMLGHCKASPLFQKMQSFLAQ